jgi:hypothetical protein
MTTCPRCRAVDASRVAASPVADRWTVFSCATCHYVWRSTEPVSATDPDSYPLAFRLDGENISAPGTV